MNPTNSGTRIGYDSVVSTGATASRGTGSGWSAPGPPPGGLSTSKPATVADVSVPCGSHACLRGADWEACVLSAMCVLSPAGRGATGAEQSGLGDGMVHSDTGVAATVFLFLIIVHNA